MLYIIINDYTFHFDTLGLINVLEISYLKAK